MRHKSWYQLDCTWNRGTDGGGVGDGLCNTFAWLQKRHGGQRIWMEGDALAGTF